MAANLVGRFGRNLLALVLVLQLSPHLWAQAPRLEGPLSLQSSLEFALAHHPTLSVLQSESLAAQARVQEAQGAFWPKLAAGLYLNTGNTPMIVSAAPTVDPPFLTRLPGGAGSLNLSLMLPLYTGGRLQARLAQAQAEERAQLARTALALQEVSRDTRRAYYEALQAESRLEASRWKLAQQEELLRLTIEKVRIGSLARYVQRRIEAELAAATQEQNSAKAEQSNALVTLSLALGAAVDSDFQLNVPAQIEMPQETVQANLQQALQDRPDLVVARILVESSDQRLYQALSAYSPQLAAYAMAEGMRQPALGNGATEGGYQVGLVLSWPLFDRERDGRTQEAKAMQSVRQHEVARLEQLVAAEVLRSRTRLEAAINNHVLASKEIEAAEADLTIAKLRFQLGRGLYLEVLDALAVRARAWQNNTSALRESGLAEADFIYALGRLK